jgi:hypothetical protein
MPQTAAEAEDKTQAEAKETAGKKSVMVPVAALEAERRKRHEAELRAAKLEGQTEGLQQRTEQDAPKEYTRAELRELVEAGKLNETQADEVMDRQLERRIMTKAEETFRATSETTTRAQRVEQVIDRYADAIPAVLTEGSAERERLVREYQYLIEHGHPENKATQLAALRAAFGPVEKLQTKHAESRETHMESGGSGGRDDTTDDADGPPKNLTAGQKAFYADAISKRVYKDWKAVREELSKWGGKKRAAR